MEYLFTEYLPHDGDDYEGIAKAKNAFKDTKVIDSVIKGLKAPDDNIRYRAVIACSSFIEDSRVIEPLIDLLKDKYLEVRRLVVQVLGYKMDRRAVKPLIEVLKNEQEDHLVRSWSAEALERIGGQEALKAVKKYWI